MAEDEKDMISFKHTQDIANLELRFKDLEKKVDELKSRYEAHLDYAKMLNKEISSLRDKIDGFWANVNLTRIQYKGIKEVLRDHLKTHLKVSQDQIKKIPLETIFREFDIAIQNQLEKLDAKDGDSVDGIGFDPIKGFVRYKNDGEKCEFYNKDYCIPCKSPGKFYECDLVKIGNQIKLDKWKPKEPPEVLMDSSGYELIEVKKADLEYLFKYIHWGKVNLSKYLKLKEKYLKGDKKE